MMRFKPPPLGSPIGWRVEFRPLEVRKTLNDTLISSVLISLAPTD